MTTIFPYATPLVAYLLSTGGVSVISCLEIQSLVVLDDARLRFESNIVLGSPKGRPPYKLLVFACFGASCLDVRWRTWSCFLCTFCPP